MVWWKETLGEARQRLRRHKNRVDESLSYGEVKDTLEKYLGSQTAGALTGRGAS